VKIGPYFVVGLGSGGGIHSLQPPPRLGQFSRATLLARNWMARPLHLQEVFDQVFAVFGEDAFGVKLDAFDRILLMAQPHDGAVGGAR